MTLAPGAKLGPYTLGSAIGAGGMGEVYRAHDDRLGRDVAVKVLPEHLRSDPDVLARFEREARAVGALSHPNIVAVHDVGSADGVSYVVMELLEGETLRARLQSASTSTTAPDGQTASASGSGAARPGGLPLRKSLEIGQQVAEGLAAAHAKGIVHRDLKPENVFLTTDGRAKILDFGLARAVVTGAKAADTRTVMSPAGGVDTTPGTVMGTVGYMAPEQVRGQASDHRADIFAFGAVLFEMLTGTRAFGGGTAVETMHEILKMDPFEQPGSTVGLAPAVEGLIRHCLEKQPDERFQSARDLAFQLRSLPSGSLSSGAAAVADGRTRARVRWRQVAAGAVAGAVLGAAALWSWPRAVDSTGPAVTFEFLPPNGFRFEPGTASAARFGGLAVSPDGRSIAFTASPGEAGLSRQPVFVRSLDDGVVRAVDGTEGASMPFWSPDGERLAFCQDLRLRYVALSGGLPQEIGDCFNPRGPGSWGPDDTILMVPQYNGPLVRMHVSGEPPETVLELTGSLDLAYFSPLWLPDGRHFLVARFVYNDALADQAALLVGTIGSDEVSVLVSDRVTAVAVAGDRLLFRTGTNLMSQPFDAGSRRLSGGPTLVAGSVSAFSAGGATLAYYAPPTGLSHGHRIAWFDRTGALVEYTGDPGSYRDPSISPDGAHLAYARADENGLFEIWSVDLARGVDDRLTEGSFVRPVWHPDGRSVVAGAGPWARFTLGLPGSEPMLEGRDDRHVVTDWSPDGRTVLVSSNLGPSDVVAWPVSPDGEPRNVAAGPGRQSHGAFSPDGHWVAYQTDASGELRVAVSAYPGPGPTLSVAAIPGGYPRWRRDGRELFYISDFRDVVVVPVDLSGATPEFGTARRLFAIPHLVLANNLFDVSADGQRFVAVVQGELDATPVTVRVGSAATARD